MDYYITDYHSSDTEAVALEDSIMKKGSPVTAGSKILANFIAPFDATVVTRLQESNIPITGKTIMREFGIDRIIVDRPELVPGAISAVTERVVPFALSNDVFGSYRHQAAKHGLYYIHPTYGTVSRFGLIPLVSSMDQIGVVCKDLKDGFALLSKIAGKDENDGAMFPETSYSYEETDKKITIGIPETIVKQADQDAQKSLNSFAEKFNTVSIKLPYFETYKQTMYILSCGEISNNINRYDGIKFGYRIPNYKGVDDLYTGTRTEAFGLETKLAAIMGSMVLSKDQYLPYYEKALKLRRLIKESLKFDNYDVIALPVEISQDPYENLSLFSLAPLAGLPSVSFSWQGYGIQLLAGVKDEGTLHTAWEVAQS